MLKQGSELHSVLRLSNNPLYVEINYVYLSIDGHRVVSTEATMNNIAI